jgi:hypothetical protein
MLRQTAFFVSMAASLVLESGCAGHWGWRDNDALLTGVALVADAIPQGEDSPENDSNPEREWTTTDGSPAVDDDGADGPRPVPPHEAASEADRRVERRTPFALAATYGALGHVDLEPCKAQGLAAGYGHVVLAFANDGTPAGVGVDLPARSAPRAHACVEKAFGALRVAAFDGSPVKVRRAFFVMDRTTTARGIEHSL